jgi:4-amino-4-deoxy-L-arabinose transferase-like glycosyltransferase
MTARRFAVALGIVVFGALALRVVYTVAVTAHPEDHPYDELYYVAQSDLVVSGEGFAKPFVGVPSADHPPLTTLAIVPATAIFGVPSDTLPQRLTMCLVGAAAVGVIGLLGRRVGGAAVGLTAATIAAVYPNLFMNDGIVMAEALTALLVATALLLVYRLRDGWSPWVAAGLGLACGLAALTRAELVLLVPFVAVPAVLGWDRSRWKERLAPLGIVVGVAVLTLAPWVIRNATTFDEPTTLGTGDGAVLLGANCDRTYSGRLLGVWSLECSTTVPETKDLSVQAKRQRDAAFDYVGDHLGRVPVVVAARVGRAFDVFLPFQTAEFGEAEGRPREAAIVGLVMYWVAVPLAIYGLVLLRRRRTAVWPLLVPFGIVVLVVTLGYGITRFRVPAEPSLVVLASAALVVLWRRIRGAEAGDGADQSDRDGTSSTIEASSSS